jgi:guanylate kinase
MKQVIWFFGSSAAGKKTLIDAIVKSPQVFKTQLKLLSDNIIVCKEALEWVTQKNHHERPNILSIAANIIKDQQDIVVLIKGQTPDLKHNLLSEFAQHLPTTEQKIVFVYTEPKEELERWEKHRAWYNPSMTEQNVISEIDYQIKLIEELKPLNIPVICVDGGYNANYRTIDYPPIIIS